MTVEKPESNPPVTPETSGTAEAAKAAAARSRKPKTETDKETSALSVSRSTTGLQLLDKPSDLPNHRPIEASHLKVISTYNVVGSSRPVTASTMEVSGSLSISGNRPIALSHLNISETYSVMGNRPVASNNIDDFSTLMGYLD